MEGWVGVVTITGEINRSHKGDRSVETTCTFHIEIRNGNCGSNTVGDELNLGDVIKVKSNLHKIWGLHFKVKWDSNFLLGEESDIRLSFPLSLGLSNCN
jgi:hypothetical protein